MPNLMIVLSEEQLSVYISDFAKVFSYQETIEDNKGKFISNPQTKKEFFVGQILEHIRAVHEGAVANEADSFRLEAIVQAKKFNKDLTGELL